jgi:hypothetical protein
VSVNKHYREQWIKTIYAKAVTLFHEARKDNVDDVPLPDLARQCANTVFQEHAHLIVGDRETMARAFMAHCRDNFGMEVALAIGAQAQADIETTQLKTHEAHVN